MDRLRPYPVALLCAVTLFIWTNRIWLAWTDDADSIARKLAWSVPITAFVVAAAVVLVAMVRGVDRRARWFVTLVRVFSAGTVLFWAVRSPMISFADHEVGFKIVHTLLAAVSMAAGLWAWMAVASPSEEPDAEAPSGDGPPSGDPATEPARS